MSPNEKAALVEAAPSENIRGADTHIIADPLDDLEAALIGYALHADTVEHLPAANVFRPGPRRQLAEVAHSLAGAGQPTTPITVKLRLDRDPNITGRAHFDALVECSTAGTLVIAPQARHYKTELEGEARRQLATRHAERAQQLLAGGPDAEALAVHELVAALNLLGGAA